MQELYEPSSDFLLGIIAENVPLVGSEMADANLRRLIAMTTDADPTNRDWATMLLAQQSADTPDVRNALLRAAEDADEAVRAEAVLGLAERDPALALPYVRAELRRERAPQMVFEAAALVASPVLVPDLRDYATMEDEQFRDAYVLPALRACETGAPAERP